MNEIFGWLLLFGPAIAVYGFIFVTIYLFGARILRKLGDE